MILHTDLLNRIAKKIKAKSYLEIGIFNPEHNFNKIDVHLKVGVDPDETAGATHKMNSDEFFLFHSSDYKSWANSDGSFQQMASLKRFDLIFIDGLHHAEQVKKDIINAWDCLTDGGVIIVHDTNPPTVETTCVPRGAQREWCGNIYKTICQIISPNKFTVDFDYGCTTLHKNGEPLEFVDHDVIWEDFDKHRQELLNLVSVEEAIKIIDKW